MIPSTGRPLFSRRHYGRDSISDVTEIADDRPVLIGQVPLELMDWVIDMRNRKLIGNPAHGGEQMIEVYQNLPTLHGATRQRSDGPGRVSARSPAVQFEQRQSAIVQNTRLGKIEPATPEQPTTA